jgi:hypothetical protein
MRGLVEDAMVQKTIRIGNRVMRKRKIVVLRPPPSFHDRYVGTPKSREINSVLEKLILPGPSAGSGGLWMAGDCGWSVDGPWQDSMPAEDTYCCDVDTAIMLDFERRRLRRRRGLEWEIRPYVA